MYKSEVFMESTLKQMTVFSIFQIEEDLVDLKLILSKTCMMVSRQ
jgi:hypothetical protein